MPIYVDESGKPYEQAKAILIMLAMKHGLEPKSADEMYELNWYYETVADHDPDAVHNAVFTDDASAELIDKCVDVTIKMMNKMEARWADGRAHCSGANVTAADFDFLTTFTKLIANTNLKNKVISDRLLAHFNTLPNHQRVLNGVKSDCQSVIDALPPSWC